MSSPVLTTAVSRSLQDKAKIHEDQELLAAIVESSEDAIIGESLDGIITSWNSGAAKMFGYANHEIVGKSVSVLHSPETAEELEGILDLIRQGKGKSHFDQNVSIRMEQKSTCRFLCHRSGTGMVRSSERQKSSGTSRTAGAPRN